MAGRNHGILRKEHKVFIVQRLAVFDTPNQVTRAVSEEFPGLTIAPQSVERYDPTKKAGARLKPDLVALFNETRERFRTNLDDIPEANVAVRVRRLARMAHQAETMRNYKLAAELLEQIARDVGGMMTNRRELSGPGGKPIPIDQTFTDLTPIEMRSEIHKLMLSLGIVRAAPPDGGEATS